MMKSRLEQRLIDFWQTAAVDLEIRVTAPIELKDATGTAFACEALVHDFGSRTGALVISPKTERRIRQHLRSLDDEVWVAVDKPSAYSRRHCIAELLDFGWFGAPGKEPDWFMRHSG